MPTDADLANLASDLRLACMRISRRVRFESANALAPHAFSVLARLGEQPRTPRELADIERVSAPSMTRTTTALVERGLIDRAPDPEDGRCVILSLTAQGEALLAQTCAARDGWMSSRVATLSRAERDVLREAVQILAKVAEQ